jgi:hypothetical protein
MKCAVVVAITVLFASQVRADGWQPAQSLLMTRWAKEVSPANSLPAYPRPTQARKDWQNLNGLWDYALTGQDVQVAPTAYEGKILVPYPYESALSGVGKPSIPHNLLWYRRVFTIADSWKGRRVLLHFGGVDWDSAVYVNGTKVGVHRGCYNGFTFDITNELKPGANELVVSASNPIDQVGDQVRGKQRLKSSGMVYRASTGIWQTVWLEPVPEEYIARLKITPDVDQSAVRISAETVGVPESGALLAVTVLDAGKEVGTATGKSNAELVVPIKNPHLWSPSDPHLYGLQVTLVGKNTDRVDSYFGLRRVGLGKNAKGQTQILLNGQFVFQVGALDQGYWPDGIYTAPTDKALRYDIEVAKQLNFNLLRKHAKVEPERWYYWADKIGMLVWQDMPQAFPEAGKWTDKGKAQFETEWRREIVERYNHPSIIVWTPFNEGWGQHDTKHIVEVTRAYDSSRLVNEGSGWENKGYGDINDIHPYPGPASVVADKSRDRPHQATANGEMGGLAIRWKSNTWQDGPGIGWFTDPDEVTDRYMRLMARSYRLKDNEGLSSIVYTQLTDVEHELNGVLTFDRAVFKFDPEKVAAANSGHFPVWKPDLVPTSLDDPQIWKYTTEKPADTWTQSDFDDSAWRSGPGTFGLINRRTEWKGSPSQPDLWIRRKVILPKDIPTKLDLLLLYDEDPEVYFNGVLAGSAKGAGINYERIPVTASGRAALKTGVNVIAAHAHDTGGACGLDVGVTEAKHK